MTWCWRPVSAPASFPAAPSRCWSATATRTRSWRCAKSPPRLLKPDEAKEDYIRSLQKHAEVDEPEEARPEADDREDPSHRQVTEEELLRALTTEAQRRAEPQPEPEADYEE